MYIMATLPPIMVGSSCYFFNNFQQKHAAKPINALQLEPVLGSFGACKFSHTSYEEAI